MSNANDILNASDDKNKYLEAIILAFEKDVTEINNQLYTELVELDATLPTDKGKIEFKEASIAKANKIDDIIDELGKTLRDTVFVVLALNMVKVSEYSKKIFIAAGFSETATDKVNAAINLVSQKLGISKTGKIIAGGYLDTVANVDFLKAELKNIVLNGISSGASVKELNKTFKEYLMGAGVQDNKLNKYFRTFIHDSVYKTARAYMKMIGDALGVNQFMYANDLIATSRDFCISRAFKIFTRSEIEDWKNLDYPYFPQPYDPFIDCGGYNCRHWLVPVEKSGEEVKGINEAADKWREKTVKEIK